MLVKVTKDTVKIVEEDYILNKGEYKVNRCYFDFSEEYTDNLVKKAIFEHGDVKIEVVINNNECDIPYEVLNFNTFEVRVYAYEVSGDDLVLRYSPTYTNAYLREGSYDADATEGEKITPSQYQQYEQALNDGLVEVNSKLDDVDTAITETNNLDITVSKLNRITTVALTKKDSTVETVQILDGEKGETGETGANGRDAKINGVNTLSIEAGDNVTIDQTGNTLTINSTGGGSGGTSDYTELTNKPKINNVELSGNKTTSDLGIVIPDVSNFITKDVNNLTYYTKTSDLSAVATSGNYNDLSNKPTIPDISGKLDTSKVKNTTSTTAGDVYDVRYINTMIGDIETLLGGI